MNSKNSDQETSLTAIDIALEPDATMLEHASAANARLRSVYPRGFALDKAHHPHITMLQRFVRTTDLDKVYAAADTVLASEKSATWTLTAIKYYYIPAPPDGLAGIVIEPTDDLLRLHSRRRERRSTNSAPMAQPRRNSTRCRSALDHFCGHRLPRVNNPSGLCGGSDPGLVAPATLGQLLTPYWRVGSRL